MGKAGQEVLWVELPVEAGAVVVAETVAAAAAIVVAAVDGAVWVTGAVWANAAVGAGKGERRKGAAENLKLGL